VNYAVRFTFANAACLFWRSLCSSREQSEQSLASANDQYITSVYNHNLGSTN